MDSEVLKFYKDYYSLPEILYEENVSPTFFDCIQSNYKFVILTIFNDKKEFLMIRNLNKSIGWELPGGFIKEGEKIVDAVNRVATQEAGILVDDVYPIAFVRNVFKCGDEIFSHIGLAFAATSRSVLVQKPENIKILFSHEKPPKMPYQNDKILDMALKGVGESFLMPPHNEIDSIKGKKLSYFLHDCFIKKIGWFASRKIFLKILECIKFKPDSILDVSCGDNDLIVKLHKFFKPSIVVANDISWKTISFIKKTNNPVIFTNHNILNFPFKNKFDLIVFKNTLHHIEKDKQVYLLKELLSWSKQLMIVDIDNPQKGNFLSKLWNFYYRFFLDDQGNDFLDFNGFKEKVEPILGGKKCDFGRINTIKGYYFYAYIYD